MKLTFRPSRALTDERRRKDVVKWLASRVGVAVAVVCLGDCSDDAHGLQLPVTIGPLPTGMAETVGNKLRACTADLAEVVKHFGVPLVAVEEPRLETKQWTFCEAVLHAAGATAKPNKCICVYRRSHACCFDGSGRCGDPVRWAQWAVSDAAGQVRHVALQGGWGSSAPPSRTLERAVRTSGSPARTPPPPLMPVPPVSPLTLAFPRRPVSGT